MRRLIMVGSMLLMMFSLSACSGRETGQQQQDRIEHSAGQHILIAYFTWAENTHVENPDSAELREPIGVYRPDVDSAQESINEWLAGMGYEKKG